MKTLARWMMILLLSLPPLLGGCLALPEIPIPVMEMPSWVISPLNDAENPDKKEHEEERKQETDT